MTMPIRSLFIHLRRFGRATDGNVNVEFVLAMPFVFWAFMASFVYFDGYRQSSVNLKAAYTISDLLSRETGSIDDTYIDSMHNMLDLLVREGSETTLRITVVRWSDADSRYYVDWSANRGFPTDLTDANVSDLATRLPNMPDMERVILVETNNTFEPLLNIGMDPIQLENFVFTRPRFAPQLKWVGADA
ncbi:pilus assembly protein [Sedimentitalea sp. CAU 1593]|jgi:Flp pilus assembly protein TadG|uniref:Pilus assembly protein n=2 Tax=Sedimentitalea arenosa TaxID=2798803 RepID=A0A8J7IMI8_9RHOB|nr:pilus assembly protein [Arenibacterium arenosum]